MADLPEPWLRGRMADVDPVIAPFLYSFTQVREDVIRWTEGLTPEQLWTSPLGLGAVGFHLRHIGGATERLTTYLVGKPLSGEQMREFSEEKIPGAPIEELLARFDEQLRRAEEIVTRIDPRTWGEPRTVGRKALPTTVGGLITHTTEHAQRHTGQLIVTVKVVRAL